MGNETKSKDPKRLTREERRERLRKAREKSAAVFGREMPPEEPETKKRVLVIREPVEEPEQAPAEKPEEEPGPTLDFERAQTTDTVHRIFLLRKNLKITDIDSLKEAADVCECGKKNYILGWGQRPKGVKGHLAVVGQDKDESDGGLYAQLREKHPLLRKYILPMEEGPYADKGGRVEELAKEISRGTADPIVMYDRAIKIIAPLMQGGLGRYRVDREWGKLPDELPTAGEVLSQETRKRTDNRTGQDYLTLTHPLEPMLLAVSALRRMGIEAYPSIGIIPQGDQDEIHTDIVSVINMGQAVPLTTFSIATEHAPIVSLDVLSDEAMMGVVHAVRAETRIKHLTILMVESSKSGRIPPDEEVALQLERIADELFECHMRWSGSHFISQALAYLENDVHAAMQSMQNINLHKVLEQDPTIADNPMLLDMNLERNAIATANLFAMQTQQFLNARILRKAAGDE